MGSDGWRAYRVLKKITFRGEDLSVRTDREIVYQAGGTLRLREIKDENETVYVNQSRKIRISQKRLNSLRDHHFIAEDAFAVAAE